MTLTRCASKAMKLTLIGCLLSGCTKGVCDTVKQQRAASALFHQFETVFYANGGLLSGSGAYKGLSQQDANAFRAPFAYLLQGIDALGRPASSEILISIDAALVGAKDFRPPNGPTGLGDVQSRFCYVIVLGMKSKLDLDEVANKSDAVSLAESSIWKWSTKGTEGHPEPHVFFARQLAHSYVLVSNSLEDLRAIGAELSTRSAMPTLTGIIDWASFSKHGAWGYRTYRHNKGAHQDAAGTANVAPDAKALSLYLDLKQQTGVLRLYSPTDTTAEKLNATRSLAPFKPAGSGTWEAIIPLSGNQKSSTLMFVAMSLFGFGVYV